MAVMILEYYALTIYHDVSFGTWHNVSSGLWTIFLPKIKWHQCLTWILLADLTRRRVCCNPAWWTSSHRPDSSSALNPIPLLSLSPEINNSKNWIINQKTWRKTRPLQRSKTKEKHLKIHHLNQKQYWTGSRLLRVRWLRAPGYNE